MQHTSASLIARPDVLDSYGRAQAIDDGFLADVTPLAREAGFRVPVAITLGLFEALNPAPTEIAEGQSLDGRLWDVLSLLRPSAKSSSGAMVLLRVLVGRAGKMEIVGVKAVMGPGDAGEPVLTIMLPHED